MPIEIPTNHTAPVFYPKENYTIVKYMDLLRFVSLLQRQALFFCRLDKLEDKFEGTIAKANHKVRRNWYKHTNSITAPLSDAEIEEKIAEQYAFEEKMKALHCVNCWNRKSTESAALWKIYSDFNKGVMLKSSISNVTKALAETDKEIQLTEIRYLDYNTEYMPDGNTNYPMLHKQKAYSYEDEVRLIYQIMPPTGWEHDWNKEEVEEGFYIKTNLSDLIDEIVISPYSPKWFFELIKGIMEKYSIDKPITMSQLSINK